jgi:hypothetical protein
VIEFNLHFSSSSVLGQITQFHRIASPPLFLQSSAQNLPRLPITLMLVDDRGQRNVT